MRPHHRAACDVGGTISDENGSPTDDHPSRLPSGARRIARARRRLVPAEHLAKQLLWQVLWTRNLSADFGYPRKRDRAAFRSIPGIPREKRYYRARSIRWACSSRPADSPICAAPPVQGGGFAKSLPRRGAGKNPPQIASRLWPAISSMLRLQKNAHDNASVMCQHGDDAIVSSA